MSLLNALELRTSVYSDLETLFQFQLDQEAQSMAAFVPKNVTDKKAYFLKWSNLLIDENVNSQTILFDKTIIGSIAKFIMDGNSEITYWLDKKFWKRGLATLALRKFLLIENSRPIYGRVAFDNIGSQKVLIKNGFNNIGTDTLKALNDDFRPKKSKYEIEEEEENKAKEKQRQDKIDRLARKFKEKNLDMIKQFMKETDRETFDIEEDFMEFANYGKSKRMEPKDCDYFLFLYLEGVGSRFDVDCHVSTHYKEYLKNYRMYQKMAEKFK